MDEIKPPIPIEALLTEIALDERVEDVRIVSSQQWAWQRRWQSSENARGVRHDANVVLRIKANTKGHGTGKGIPAAEEYAVATLRLEGETVTHIDLDEAQHYGLVRIVERAVG